MPSSITDTQTTPVAPSSPDAPATTSAAAPSAPPPAILPNAADVPGLNEQLVAYLSRPPADENARPLGLEVFAYGSSPIATTPLITAGNERASIVGAHGTPPEVAQLAEMGLANFGNPEWMQFVAHAVQQNGGLGNSMDGFLAYSREMGFVRLRHPGFSAEQNRRLAALSLQTGWPIERLPCRQEHDDTLADANANEWVEEFLHKSETALAKFVADPTQPLKVKDGSRNGYVMQLDEASGRFVSGTYRKRGGFAGWAQNNMKVIGPILDVFSVVANVVPALGTAVAAGAQLVKTGLGYAATGTIKASQVIASAASFLGSAFSQTFGFLTTPAGRGVTALGADLAEDGRISPLTVVSALGPVAIKDLPGGAIVDRAAQQFANLVAGGIVRGRVSASDVVGVLAPFIVGARTPAGAIDQAAGAVDGGLATAGEITGALEPLIASLTEDRAVRELLSQGLAQAGRYIDSGQFTAQDFVSALIPVIAAAAKDARNESDRRAAA